MENLNFKNLCIVGDIHGEFPTLVRKTEDFGIEDTALIVAGDFGLGFDKKLKRLYPKLHKRLEKRNNCIYGVRGNHDNPESFNPESELFVNLPRLKALPDFTRLSWGTREILVIGGATSRDKDERTEGEDWWPDENITKDTSPLEMHEDIIISHEAPLCIGPVATRHEGMSLEIYHKILEDRRFLDQVLKETRPRRWYFGHYHRPTSGNWGETLWKGLEINEIIEVRDEIC